MWKVRSAEYELCMKIMIKFMLKSKRMVCWFEKYKFIDERGFFNDISQQF